MKKYFLIGATSLFFHSQLCTAFLLFDHAAQSHVLNEKTQISPAQIQRLTETIDAIQQYYITKPDERTLFDNAIRGMVMHLDPHSSFLDKQDMAELQTTVSGEFVGIGVELTTERGMLRVISPIEGTPAAKAGIKPGDLIIKVDNKLIQDMTVSEAIHHIKGKPGTVVNLTILRKNEQKPLLIPVNREVVHVKNITQKMLAPGYGYVRLAFFQGPVADELKAAITKLMAQSNGHLKGFVLDLRNNPGGLLDVSADVVDLFLDKGKTTQYRNVIVYTKGRIAHSDIKFYSHNHDMIPHVPMIVLINGGSASASEIVAGALQDYKRAIVMGTRSFGKGSVQTVIPIGKHDALKLTTALYYTPSGREIQARGIEPDVIVPELTVDEKKISGLLDFDEATYNHHIANQDGKVDLKKSHNAEQQKQQTELITLAKEDYQLYEGLMMLQGMHASMHAVANHAL